MPMVKNFCRFNLGFYESEVIKMCNVKNILAAMLLVFAATIFGSAEAAIVTDKMPLQCYVDHKVTSYDTRSGQAVGWIDAEVDLVKIRGIDGNGVAIGTHPGRNGTVERLFWARDVFADTNYSNRPAHIDHYQQVYRTQNSNATIGSVNNEDVTVVADNGNRAQIIYRLDNGTGYKMGWVPSSVVRPNVTNIKGDLNNDGKVDNTDADLMRKVMVGAISESQINRNNADMDGDGEPASPADMAILLDMINDPTPTPNNKLQDLINRLNGSRWVDHSYSSTSIQCKEFAQYICARDKIFGI